MDGCAINIEYLLCRRRI